MYGETWVNNLRDYSFMSKLCCISDLIRFMVKEGEKITKGSVYEDYFYSARYVGTRDSGEDNKTDAKK